MKWVLIVATLATLVGGGGAIYAADGAAPGDPLYGLDRAIERVRLNQAMDPLQVIKLQMAFAEERLAEAGDLADRGESDHYQQAFDDYDAAVFAVVEIVGSAKEVDYQALDGVLESGFSSHEPLLARMSPAADENDDLDDNDEDEDPVSSKWCTGEEQHKVGLRLAERYGVEYDQIIGWYCDRVGWGDISAAYELSELVDNTVGELLGMLTGGMEWGDIKESFGLVGGPDDDDYDDGDDGRDWCASEEEHPAGLRIAERYGASYEEIIGWFCENFGFGEISLAYGISEQAGVDVSELFEEKSAGMGWGEIKQAHEASGKPEKDEKPDKGGKPENVPPGKAEGHNK